jgi:hypothetical protein
MSSNARSEILRVDLQLVVELSEHDSDCLSAAGVHVVGDVDLPTLMKCTAIGLSIERADEIYKAVNVFVERMLRT